LYEGTLYFFHCRVIFTHVRTSEFNWLYVHKSIKRVPKVSTAMHTQKLTKMLKKSWANFNFFSTLTLIRPHSSPILFPWNQLNLPPYFSKIYEKEKSKRSYDERWAKSVMVNKNLGGKKRNACSNKHLQASTTRSPPAERSRLQRAWSEFDSGIARLTWQAVDFQNDKPRWRLPGFKRNTTFGSETVFYVSCPWALGVVELEV